MFWLYYFDDCLLFETFHYDYETKPLFNSHTLQYLYQVSLCKISKNFIFIKLKYSQTNPKFLNINPVQIYQSLSNRSDTFGISSFIPFLFRIDFTIYFASTSSKGFPSIGSQWLNTHCGKALPSVFSLSNPENP